MDYVCEYNHYGDVVMMIKRGQHARSEISKHIVDRFGRDNKVVWVAYCRECHTNFAPMLFSEFDQKHCKCDRCKPKQEVVDIKKNKVRAQGMVAMLQDTFEDLDDVPF